MCGAALTCNRGLSVAERSLVRVTVLGLGLGEGAMADGRGLDREGWRSLSELQKSQNVTK